MHPKASFCCLLLTVLLHFNDARLVPVEHAANEPLAIDAIVANALPMANHGIIKRQATAPLRATVNTSVCYPLVGCFDNNEPFNNAALEIPQPPDFINTAFLFYSQESPTNPEFLAYDDDESIQKADITPSRWLRIIVHGFTNNRESVWMKKMKDELLKLTNDELSDVMLVDWGDGAKFPAYANAASNTRLVGKQIGLLLEKLKTMKGISYDKVHCIGHSLGAHTCGTASFSLGSQLARVSGLDPAGPFFSGKKPAVRLDKGDAKFVDVIHSNTEIALGLGLGSADESGHIDFYVNGGQSQPGCPSMGALIGGVIGGQSQAAYEQASCSHGRAHGYFIESIHSECPYTAFPCHDYDSFMDGKCLVCPITGCAQMGFYSIYSLGRGRMYSTTKSASPFCGYHYFIEMVLDRDMVKTGGEVFVAIFSDYEMLANVSMTKSGADIKSGDVIRHVFSYQADLGNVDYAIVYFSKAKSFLGWGGQKGNEVVISRLRLKSLEDSAVYSGPCETSTSVTAYTSETILLHRFDCLE